MDPVTSVVEIIKELAKSSEGFFNDGIRTCSNSSNHNPIEILKRLQQEAFYDLVKLRDRQDKVERMLSFNKSGKGGPFQEASTHMKGIIDVVGALLFVENDDKLACNALDRVGMRTGIDLRFIFETAVRQKDLLVAEFVASQNSVANHGNLCGSPLILEKVMYLANINDWVSVITTPLGAQCNEYGIGLKYAQGRRLGSVSSFVPPLFSQYHSCGAGVMVKGSKIAASLAELVSGLGLQPDTAGSRSLGTFWQVTYQPLEEIRLTFSCLRQMCWSPSHLFKLGTLVVPVGRLKRRTSSDVQVQASASDTGRQVVDGISSGSIALMLESEYDGSTNLGGWIEVHKSSPNLLHWGVSFSDTPVDELGWGLRIGGKIEEHVNQFQLEGFLNFNLGKKVSLQPGLVYAMDGKARSALVFRSSWFM